MPLVFVYGTLMRAGANHDVLARLGCRFVAAATTREPRVLVDLGPYPALLPSASHAAVRSRARAHEISRVSGEVWEIDDSALRELDAFEGCPELYTRDRIGLAVEADDDARRELEAFVYVLARRPPAHARVIASGRYGVAGTALPEGAAPSQIEAPSDGQRRKSRG